VIVNLDYELYASDGRFIVMYTFLRVLYWVGSLEFDSVIYTLL